MGLDAGFVGVQKQLFAQHVPAIFRQSLAVIEDLEGSQRGARMKPIESARLRSMTAILVGQSFMVTREDEAL